MIIYVIPERGRKRIVTKENIDQRVLSSGGTVTIEVTFKDLGKVEDLLNVFVKTDPTVMVSIPQNVTRENNKVTFDLVVGSGTTLTGTAIAIGY